MAAPDAVAVLTRLHKQFDNGEDEDSEEIEILGPYVSLEFKIWEMWYWDNDIDEFAIAFVLRQQGKLDLEIDGVAELAAALDDHYGDVVRKRANKSLASWLEFGAFILLSIVILFGHNLQINPWAEKAASGGLTALVTGLVAYLWGVKSKKPTVDEPVRRKAKSAKTGVR